MLYSNTTAGDFYSTLISDRAAGRSFLELEWNFLESPMVPISVRISQVEHGFLPPTRDFEDLDPLIEESHPLKVEEPSLGLERMVGQDSRPLRKINV